MKKYAIFGNRPYKCSDYDREQREISYHRKHTTYVEITIPKKEIEFHLLKKDLEDKSTNR